MKFRLALGLVLLAPAMAQALGLGEMRLASGLNQPIAADIEIVGASNEELQQLRAGLPSREMFARYGVDRPPFLSGFTLTVAKDGSGRPIIKVRSNESVTEPFVTFLVEVTWPRGHLIREYTALLDPPVFAPKEAPAPAVAAAQTGESTAPAAGAVVRPAPAPTPEPTAPISAPVTTSSAPPAAASSGAASSSVTAGDYTVVAHDTLSGIARRSGAVGHDDINRLMIATYRANPSAFDGNINRLHKGAVLHIPGSSDWSALDAAAARREVHQQMADWRQASGGAKPAGEEAHLRLVPPSEPTTAPQPGTGAAGTPSAEAQQRAAAEASAAAEQKRLLELRNQALAQTQQQAKPPAPAATPPAPAVQPPAATPPPAETPPPASAEPAAPTPAAPKPAPAKAPAPAGEPSFLDTLTDNWMYVGGGLAAIVLIALFALSTLRRKRAERAFDRALEPTVEPDDSRGPPRVQRGEVPPREAMLVEESEDDSGEFVAPPIAVVPRVAPKIEPTATTTQSIEDTMSSDTAINLEQADPLAEADFHMAYGLYDQAADIVKLAIGREPARRDLKLKLLEVYFVWGNRDAFLDVARDLGRSRDAGAAGEWDKVVIMGRQIAPDDPLFAGAAAPSGATDVDLDLEAGGNQGVDLELLGGEGPSTSAGAADEHMDLDLSQALAGNDSSADTGESPTLDPDRLDLMFDAEPGAAAADRGGGTTREMRPQADLPTVEQPALRSSEAPTVETPVLDPGREGTIRNKLDTALRRGERTVAPDATAELSLDDLGFEVDKLGSTSASLPALSVTDHPSDAPTMVAGLDDNTRALLQAAGRSAKADLEPTRESPRPSGDLEPTRESPRPAGHGDTGLDLDLDELARALESDTVEQPRREEMRFSTDVFQTAIRKAPNGLDLDVGAPLGDSREPTVTERINADEMSLPELEPVTLSEVGTKLDLARAYMDMGDPDGARSILQEVLSEGSASQRQEAQRLIETLPG